VDEVMPIGVIGLGLMGSALAERLLGAGHRVVGWDVDPGRIAALGERGGEVAKDAPQIFSECRRVLLSLPSHREARDVVEGAGAVLTPGLTIIDTTTGDPAGTEALAKSLGARGITMLDAGDRVGPDTTRSSLAFVRPDELETRGTP
jgi:3-hydroxyisobutyrate dehydrogenase-like beta-hydroxyacid dehydrogenase